MPMKLFDRLAVAAYGALALCAAAIHSGFWTLTEQGRLPVCLFKAVTGLPCPGCGMAHAIILAFQGDWRSSLHEHPLGIPVLMIWTAWLAWGLRNRLKDREFSRDFPLRLEGAPAVAALVIVLAVYAVRIAGASGF